MITTRPSTNPEPTPAPEAPDGANAAPPAAPRSASGGRPARQADPFDALWSVFSSPKLALFLILAISAACLAGALIHQAPPEVLRTADATRTWVERNIRPRFGFWTDPIQLLGLFWVFQTPWFRGLLGLLTINTVVCTANRLPGIWRQVFGQPTWPREALFERGEPRETVLLPARSVEAAAPALRQALGRRFFRVVEHPPEADAYVYADRFRFARLGTLLTHTALVLVFATAVLSAPLGFFEESGFAVSVGTTREVGHDTNLAVMVEDFADEYYPDGRPKDYRSDLVLYEAGQEVARQTIRVNEPLIYNGVRFHQAYYGNSAAMTVKDANGNVLLGEAVPLTWRSNDGQRAVGFFSLPSSDLNVYLVGTAGKGDTLIRSGEIVAEIYRGRATFPTYRETLTQRQPKTVGGLELTFEREIPFTGLRVVRDRGADLIWLASTMLVLGLVLAFYFPHQRLWARLQPDADGARVVLVGAGKELAGELRRIAQQLRPAGAPQPATVQPEPAEPRNGARLRRVVERTHGAAGRADGHVKNGPADKAARPTVAAARAPRGGRHGH